MIKALLITLLCVSLLCPFSARARIQGTATKSQQAVKSTSRSKTSPDLRMKKNNGRGNDLVRVIIQPASVVAGRDIDTELVGLAGRNVRKFRQLGFRVANMSANAALALAERPEVAHVSLDREVRTLGHVSYTTGADYARTDDGVNSGVDGTGIGIAILDSGIDNSHKSFLDKNNYLRVVVNRDFTGENRTDDPYGHGTHVASIAAGSGRLFSGQYMGIAPNASLLNLRVLNSNGIGSTEGVLAALDWVSTNHATYNIRVVNMSLGMAAIDSYKNDPVCLAVRSLVDSGVVVTAAAGNNGINSDGTKVYGHIHAPGNEPSAITVGASNTFGTDDRGDDVVTSFSSRGPTRSYWTDDAGERHYDNLIKPDLVAPGNKLIDAEALNNALVTANPQLDAGVSSTPEKKMMYLSGTSMATPVVAGAAAPVSYTHLTLPTICSV